jgi:AcrR family transcriptional regulator
MAELTERKRREFELRRKFIIDIAERLFYEHGYEAVTLNQLAKECNYTKATLYTYLTCKDEIYLEVYCRGFEMRTNYLEEHMQHSENGFLEVRSFGKAYFEFYKANPQILYHQQYLDFRPIEYDRLPEQLVEKFMKLNERSSKLLIAAFEKGLADGSLKQDLNIDFFIGQFVLTLRSCASAVVYGKKVVQNHPYTEETNNRWYYGYLDLIMSAIKGI